jgi:hypothetical protein
MLKQHKIYIYVDSNEHYNKNISQKQGEYVPYDPLFYERDNPGHRDMPQRCVLVCEK